MIERSSSNQENPFSDGAVLSVRLWTGDAGDPTSESVWKNATSAASVAVDLVNASGGIGVVTAGNLLVSKFSSVPTAILAAKRIQWAISGCTEAGGDGSGSATILIQSVDDYSSEGSSAAPNPSLEQAFPGQILLAEATCKSLENLPGLPLSPPIAGLRELQWRTSENAPSRLQDDQALAQFLQQHGLEDPEPEIPEGIAAPVPAVASVPSAPPEKSVPARLPAENTFNPEEDGWLLRLREMPLWLKSVSAAIPIAIVVTLFFVFFHAKPPAHAPDQPAAVVSPPQQTPKTAAPADTTVVTQPPVAKSTKSVSSKATDARHNPHSGAADVKQASSCGLNSIDIPSELSIADARFQNRQYKEAERRYRSVLACQPENSHAASGAERARTALQLQQSSNP